MSITCGHCTKSLGRAMGCEIKHDSVAEVKACHARYYDFKRLAGEDLFECSWLYSAGRDEDGEQIIRECGAPARSIADGWVCLSGHEHVTYGSPRQQAQERVEAFVEDWASRDARIAGLLDAGDSALDIAAWAGVR